MTSPRIIDFSDPVLEYLAERLSPAEGGKYAEEAREYSAAKKSISDQLWDSALNVANSCWQANYIKGINEGSLSPGGYGQYSVQDCAYCVNATANYQIMISLALAAGEPSIAKFAMYRYYSYQKYTKGIFDTWGIKDPSALTLSREVVNYIEFERSLVYRVATEGPRGLHPIYFILAMIPCSRLWVWLANKMTPSSQNIYNFWIVQNRTYQGDVSLLENFVNTFFDQQSNIYNEDAAKNIYRRALELELDLFESIKVLRIDKLDPEKGAASQLVAITGAFPHGVDAVFFKDKKARVESKDTNRITCISPAELHNIVDVYVTDELGNNSNVLKYTYKK